MGTLGSDYGQCNRTEISSCQVRQDNMTFQIENLATKSTTLYNLSAVARKWNQAARSEQKKNLGEKKSSRTKVNFSMYI